MNASNRPETTLRDRLGRAKTVAAAQAGFTLVEMLVVLAIIGLLVGLVAPRVFGQLAEAKVRTAHIQIESFKNALDLFYLDAGRYPTTQEGLQALNTRPVNLQNWAAPMSREPTCHATPGTTRMATGRRDRTVGPSTSRPMARAARAATPKREAPIRSPAGSTRRRPSCSGSAWSSRAENRAGRFRPHRGTGGPGHHAPAPRLRIPLRRPRHDASPPARPGEFLGVIAA